MVSGYPAIEERAQYDFQDRIPFWYGLLETYTVTRGSLLEIGCAHGGFLQYCRAHGIENVVGVEVDEETCGFARDYFNLPHIHSGLFPDVSLPIAKFDIITGFDVIEHFIDPVAGITAVSDYLTDDGIFIFQTPCYRYDTSNWAQFRPAEHVFLFNKTSIQKLFNKCGLEISHILPGYFADDMFVIGHKAKKYRKLLFIRTDSIGDNILASSMLPLLAKKYSDAQITVFCQEQITELYEINPHITRVIGFNRINALQDESYRNELLKQIQESQYDICLSTAFSRDMINDFFAMFSGAKQRIAMEGDTSNISETTRQNNNRYYTQLLPSGSVHESELARHRKFLSGVGIETGNLAPTLWVTPEDVTFADRFFTEQSLDPQKTIALFAGARHSARVYDRYGAALADVCGENHFTVISLGSADDFSINQVNLDAAGVPTMNLCGKTTLRQSAAIISRCRLAVGAETGVAHIACAVETANVILLGGGHFGRFIPYSCLTSVVCLPLECYGCNWACSYDKAHCVQGIDHSVLETAIRETLENNAGHPRIFAQGEHGWNHQSNAPRWCNVLNSHLHDECITIEV